MIIPVILAGGSGSRLWPLSRASCPKPFVFLPDGTTMMGRTCERVAGMEGAGEMYMILNRQHYSLARKCMPQSASFPEKTFILEPSPRNTAAAIALAAVTAGKKYGRDTVMLVLPADHLVEDHGALYGSVKSAAGIAADGHMVMFGIRPVYPEPEYGYIEAEDGRVVRFTEKPGHDVAEQYGKSGRHFWNSGMFCFSVHTILSAMKRYCSDILSPVMKSLDMAVYEREGPDRIIYPDKVHFDSSRDLSVDYAVMQKAQDIRCIITSCGWSDAGSWTAFSNFFKQDDSANRINGHVSVHDTRNCIVMAGDRPVSLAGVENLVIVDTPDALLVSDRKQASCAGKIFCRLPGKDRKKTIPGQVISRPWGSYSVLEEGECFKVKKIVVKPGARLSLQTHRYRSEHWVVVSGNAGILNGNREDVLSPGQSAYIPRGSRHCLENTGTLPLVLIEIQSGRYLGEDDIVRHQDIYGRA